MVTRHVANHLLVLDDSTPKTRPLLRAVTYPTAKGGLGGFEFQEFAESRARLEDSDEFRSLDRFNQATELLRHDAEFPYTLREVDSVKDLVHLSYDLATADALFIDFKLETLRFNTDARHEVRLGETTHEVQLTTGIGALLYLNDFLKDDDYWEARQAARPYKRIDPQDPEHQPQIFSYVNPRESSSKFFATAAEWWFGVPCFPQPPDPKTGAIQLEHILGGGTLPEPSEQRIRVLHLLLTSLEDSRAGYLGDDHRGRDVRRWLAAYMVGGCTKEAFKQVIDVKKIKNVTTQLAGQLQPIYGYTKRFASLWPQLTDEWADTLEGDEQSGRHFQQFLSESSEFWTAQDVGIAYDLWLSGSLRRLGPVPLPADLAGYRQEKGLC